MTTQSFNLIDGKHNIESIQHIQTDLFSIETEDEYIMKNHKFDIISIQSSSDQRIYSFTKPVFINK